MTNPAENPFSQALGGKKPPQDKPKDPVPLSLHKVKEPETYIPIYFREVDLEKLNLRELTEIITQAEGCERKKLNPGQAILVDQVKKEAIYLWVKKSHKNPRSVQEAFRLFKNRSNLRPRGSESEDPLPAPEPIPVPENTDPETMERIGDSVASLDSDSSFQTRVEKYFKLAKEEAMRLETLTRNKKTEQTETAEEYSEMMGRMHESIKPLSPTAEKELAALLKEFPKVKLVPSQKLLILKSLKTIESEKEKLKDIERKIRELSSQVK